MKLTDVYRQEGVLKTLQDIPVHKFRDTVEIKEISLRPRKLVAKAICIKKH